MGATCSAMAVARSATIVPAKPGLECSICMELVCPTVQLTTNCGHAFCSTCIWTWLKDNKTCPHCREEVRTLMTPRTMLRETKIKLRRARKRDKVRRGARHRLRKERIKAAKRMAAANMRAEITRMREEGFHHGGSADPEVAREHYLARVEMYHRRRRL